jgi:hypothetical protein
MMSVKIKYVGRNVTTSIGLHLYSIFVSFMWSDRWFIDIRNDHDNNNRICRKSATFHRGSMIKFYKVPGQSVEVFIFTNFLK